MELFCCFGSKWFAQRKIGSKSNSFVIPIAMSQFIQESRIVSLNASFQVPISKGYLNKNLKKTYIEQKTRTRTPSKAPTISYSLVLKAALNLSNYSCFPLGMVYSPPLRMLNFTAQHITRQTKYLTFQLTVQKQINFWDGNFWI